MRAAAPRLKVCLLALCFCACDRHTGRPDSVKSPRVAVARRSPNACWCDPARLDARPVVWGAASAGLRLGVAVDGTCVRLRIENAGAQPLLVFSGVYGGARLDLEGYTLRLLDAAGAVTEVDLRGGSRRESGPLFEPLAPGESLRHDIDVAAGGCYDDMPTPPAPRGEYRVMATYEPRRYATRERWADDSESLRVERVDGACPPKSWCGRLAAGPATLRAP